MAPQDTYFGSRPVAWDEVRAANKLNWNSRAKAHKHSYGLERYIANKSLLSEEIAFDAPLLCKHLGRTFGPNCLAGLRVAHLQCHIGSDTVSLARLGAKVCGLDFSPESLAVAREFAQACDQDIRWVESDVLEAATAIGEPFDVVYTSVGTISWLADLDRWAAQIEKLLADGGIFYIRDAHPAMLVYEDMSEHIVPKYRYFTDGTPDVWDEQTSYTGDAIDEHTRTYDYPHPLSEIFGVLLSHGLTIERFEEGCELPWQYSPVMVPASTSTWWKWPEELEDKIPCTFTIVARKS